MNLRRASACFAAVLFASAGTAHAHGAEEHPPAESPAPSPLRRDASGAFATPAPGSYSLPTLGAGIKLLTCVMSFD